jgi:cytochrome c peroxidase
MPLVNLALGSPEDTPRLVEFMRTLTDPCLKTRSCIGKWIPAAQEAPDTLQLNAVDAQGHPQ